MSYFVGTPKNILRYTIRVIILSTAYSKHGTIIAIREYIYILYYITKVITKVTVNNYYY